jgi:hypothetical protein
MKVERNRDRYGGEQVEEEGVGRGRIGVGRWIDQHYG